MVIVSIYTYYSLGDILILVIIILAFNVNNFYEKPGKYDNMIINCSDRDLDTVTQIINNGKPSVKVLWVIRS